jgi:endo-1,4-beta-xylanase
MTGALADLSVAALVTLFAQLPQLPSRRHAQQLLPPGPRLRDLAEARNPPLLIGTDLVDSFPFPATGNPADCVGGNASAPGCTANASYRAIAANEFSGANADFSLVWIAEQPTPADVFDFHGSDLILAFMRDSNQTYAHINAVLPSGHNVLTGCCVPTWLTDGYPYAAATRRNYTYNWTQAQVRGFMQRRIEVAVPRWLNSGVEVRGIFPINEAVANQPISGRGGWPNTWLYGPEENIMSWAWDNSTEYFGQIFRWVRAAADKAGHPKLRLFYNDYGIETPGPKADAVLKWLVEQRAKGVPIDGIGFQSHLPCDCQGASGCNNTDVVAANMRRFVDAGFQVRMLSPCLPAKADSAVAVALH